MAEKIAKFVKDCSEDFKGTAFLFKMSPPMRYREYDCDTDKYKTHRTTYVIVSAVVVLISGAETYIFAADRFGNIKNWTELGGSYRGGLNHEEALNNAGFSVEW